MDPESLPFFDDMVFSPVHAVAQAPPDVSIEMKFAFDTFDNGMNRAAFNEM